MALHCNATVISKKDFLVYYLTSEVKFPDGKLHVFHSMSSLMYLWPREVMETEQKYL